MSSHRPQNQGFTLIELAIVLVIIGFIVGGVLVGQDLITASSVRAQISQIEKLQTAVNVFRFKYNALPGDMDATTATTFGFAPRGQYQGEGDGNGLIQGIYSNGPNHYGPSYQSAGETVMFWSDITYANGMNLNLIEGSFITASETSVPSSIALTQIGNYLPQAKIGRGNYIYVWHDFSGFDWFCGTSSWCAQYRNHFSIAKLSAYTNSLNATTGFSVQEAYKIDRKIDDGLPQSGNIITIYVDGNGISFSPSASTDTSSTCFNTAAGSLKGVYSYTYNNGSGLNCALSFQFQ